MRDQIQVIERPPHIWVCATPFAGVVRESLLGREGAFDSMSGATILKDNDARTIMSINLNPDKHLFVKRFKMNSFLERAKAFLFSSKAYREWFTLRSLAAREVKVPQPLALLETRRWGCPVDCYLFTDQVRNAVTLRELVSGSDVALGPELRAVLRAVAVLVDNVHKADYYHKDLHTGNVLVRSMPGAAPETFLLDVHRGSFTSLRRGRIVDSLAQMYHSIRHVGSWRAGIGFLREYAAVTRFDARSLIRDVCETADRLRVRHITSRAARSLQASSAYRMDQTPDWRIFRRAEFPYDAVVEIVKAHTWQVENARSSLVKDHPTRRISIVSTDAALMARDYIVKEELHQGFLHNLGRALGMSRSRRSWRNSHALRLAGVPAPEAYALVEEPPGRNATNSSLVISQREAGTVPLDRFVRERFPANPLAPVKDRRRFARDLARFVGRVHERGVYHGDLKANNVLVGEREGGETVFSVLDIDRVRIVRRVSNDMRVTNLAQLNASLPAGLTRADRLAAFRAYWRCRPSGRQVVRSFVGAVMDLTRARKHVWPVQTPGTSEPQL
ncbi:MAG: lipopolysaccharide kinase InaA family protein [Planctomycetota bacterium]|nr:lipopolysaccharide kinase InaA family protein [Planctomycetota bacterium]